MKRLVVVVALAVALVACGSASAPRPKSEVPGRKTFPMPSSSMEPTIHCGKPGIGCLARQPDIVVTRATGATRIRRLVIVAFTMPRKAASVCGAGGTLVKRVIGRPGETVREDGNGFIWLHGADSKAWVKLIEPYVSDRSRKLDSGNHNRSWKVPPGKYFVMGDNRAESCDSRSWGSVAAGSIIGPVVQIVRKGKTRKPAGSGYVEQGVQVHVTGPNALFELSGKLEHSVSTSGLGKYDGDGAALDGSGADFFAYGPDADALWNVMKPIVEADHPPRGSYATLQYGSDLPFDRQMGTVRIDLP
jgi:signal peptidase I